MAQTPSTKLQNALVVRKDHELAKRRKTQIAVGTTVAAAAILGAVGFALATRSNRETVSRYASRLGDFIPGREEPSSAMRAKLTDLSDNIRDLLRR